MQVRITLIKNINIQHNFFKYLFIFKFFIKPNNNLLNTFVSRLDYEYNVYNFIVVKLRVRHKRIRT